MFEVYLYNAQKQATSNATDEAHFSEWALIHSSENALSNAKIFNTNLEWTADSAVSAFRFRTTATNGNFNSFVETKGLKRLTRCVVTDRDGKIYFFGWLSDSSKSVSNSAIEYTLTFQSFRAIADWRVAIYKVASANTQAVHAALLNELDDYFTMFKSGVVENKSCEIAEFNADMQMRVSVGRAMEWFEGNTAFHFEFEPKFDTATQKMLIYLHFRSRQEPIHEQIMSVGRNIISYEITEDFNNVNTAVRVVGVGVNVVANDANFIGEHGDLALVIKDDRYTTVTGANERALQELNANKEPQRNLHGRFIDFDITGGFKPLNTRLILENEVVNDYYDDVVEKISFDIENPYVLELSCNGINKYKGVK